MADNSHLTSKLDVFGRRLTAGCVLDGALSLGFRLLKSAVLGKPGNLKSVGEAWLSQAFTF